MANYIRFDWAMKHLLRDKANFSVLEGLLTTLLNEKITIRRLLESESNQESEFDKYNRVDILAEDSKGTLILFEIQNNNEYAYFQRMLFGVSKLVTEYINRGEGYENIRKIYSVNIVYFALGSGSEASIPTNCSASPLSSRKPSRRRQSASCIPNIISSGSTTSTNGRKCRWNNGYISSTPAKSRMTPPLQAFRRLANASSSTASVKTS